MYLRMLHREPLIEVWTTLTGADFRPVLPSIDIPALLVYGDESNFFTAAIGTSSGQVALTLPVMVASQTGSQGINWWSMAALSTTAIAPLAIVGIFLERYIVKGLTAGSIK